MNTDRTASHLDVVEHHIVLAAAHSTRVGLDHVDIFEQRRGEQMLAGVPTLFLCVPKGKGEIDHPTKSQQVRVQ